MDEEEISENSSREFPKKKKIIVRHLKRKRQKCIVISYANCQEQITENKIESRQKAKEYSMHNRQNYGRLQLRSQWSSTFKVIKESEN